MDCGIASACQSVGQELPAEAYTCSAASLHPVSHRHSSRATQRPPQPHNHSCVSLRLIAPALHAIPNTKTHNDSQGVELPLHARAPAHRRGQGRGHLPHPQPLPLRGGPRGAAGQGARRRLRHCEWLRSSINQTVVKQGGWGRDDGVGVCLPAVPLCRCALVVSRRVPFIGGYLGLDLPRIPQQKLIHYDLCLFVVNHACTAGDGADGDGPLRRHAPLEGVPAVPVPPQADLLQPARLLAPPAPHGRVARRSIGLHCMNRYGCARRSTGVD